MGVNLRLSAARSRLQCIGWTLPGAAQEELRGRRGGRLRAGGGGGLQRVPTPPHHTIARESGHGQERGVLLGMLQDKDLRFPATCWRGGRSCAPGSFATVRGSRQRPARRARAERHCSARMRARTRGCQFLASSWSSIGHRRARRQRAAVAKARMSSAERHAGPNTRPTWSWRGKPRSGGRPPTIAVPHQQVAQRSKSSACQAGRLARRSKRRSCRPAGPSRAPRPVIDAALLALAGR
jgi:hypothetical protein